jgi:hypothetical protein
MKKKIPFENRSPHGWWIAAYVTRFEYYDEDKKNLNRRCLAWENTIILKAKDRNEAYRKAVRLGKLANGQEMWEADSGRKGAWRFEGLTSLLPIYEELEDGAEVMWRKYANRTVKKIRALAKPKEKLEAFDDKPAD